MHLEDYFLRCVIFSLLYRYLCPKWLPEKILRNLVHMGCYKTGAVHSRKFPNLFRVTTYYSLQHSLKRNLGLIAFIAFLPLTGSILKISKDVKSANSNLQPLTLCFFGFFFLSGFSFTNIHESQDCWGRGREFL